MFGDGMQKNELPLIIVCDDKDWLYWLKKAIYPPKN